MLDRVLSFKREYKKINNKIVECYLYMIVHNGSGFDSYFVPSNLPQCRSFVNLIENGGGIVSPKLFNEEAKEMKKIPQYVHFRFGNSHIKSSLKEIVFSYKLQPSLLKQDMEHYEIYEDTWEARENEWLPYV